MLVKEIPTVLVFGSFRDPNGNPLQIMQSVKRA